MSASTTTARISQSRSTPVSGWLMRHRSSCLPAVRPRRYDRFDGIRPVALPASADALELLHDHMRDALASAAHEAYLDSRAEAPDFGDRPADRSWDQLAPEFIRASRAHVDGMIEQLQAIWFEIEPLYDWDDEPAHLDHHAIEAMARLEHDRWCRDKMREGWRYGVPRDNAKKRHDLLVFWSDLGETDRDIGRKLAAERPAMLCRAGFRLRHSPIRESLARALHERYVESQLAKGAGGPLVIPWAELDEQQREHSRATVDDIALKLASIGGRTVPSFVAANARAALSHAEVETLAQLEHERWLRERRALAWTLGGRDDAKRSHPSLVSWSELSEAEREKDREHVRAIPGAARERWLRGRRERPRSVKPAAAHCSHRCSGRPPDAGGSHKGRCIPRLASPCRTAHWMTGDAR